VPGTHRNRKRGLKGALGLLVSRGNTETMRNFISVKISQIQFPLTSIQKKGTGRLLMKPQGIGDSGKGIGDRGQGITTATRRHIPEDRILYGLRHEDLESYIALTGWIL
jgi:hypothetical protein